MDLLLLLKAAIMGIVEGLTEFLPISSTGHLILAGSLLDFTGEKVKVFEIAIQTGAMFAVVWEYRQRIASTFARVLGFDGVAVTATAFETETESYIITSGTGEGGDFAYLASDVESFLDGLAAEGRKTAHYSEDFCAAVSPVEDVELAWAALAEGAVLCRAGDCRAILQGQRCEAGRLAHGSHYTRLWRPRALRGDSCGWRLLDLADDAGKSSREDRGGAGRFRAEMA